MKEPTNGWAQRAVRWWVSLYTWGLPSDLRDRRRAEIDSDFWEHQSEIIGAGARTLATTSQVLARWLLGVPADLSWRLQAASGLHPRATKTLDQPWQVRLGGLAFIGIGGFLVMASLLGSGGVLFGHLVTMNEADPGWVLLILLLDGLTILAGLRLMHQSPKAAAGVVTVGALVFSMAWYWTVLGPLLGLGLALLGILRGTASIQHRC